MREQLLQTILDRQTQIVTSGNLQMGLFLQITTNWGFIFPLLPVELICHARCQNDDTDLSLRGALENVAYFNQRVHTSNKVCGIALLSLIYNTRNEEVCLAHGCNDLYLFWWSVIQGKCILEIFYFIIIKRKEKI